MGKTIKGKLTVSMIGIVVVSILLTTIGIVVVAGKQTIQDQTQALQLNADKYAEGRLELLNLYCGSKDSRFIQSNREAGILEGYDPVERGWYQQAAELGAIIVTDPYCDAITGRHSEYKYRQKER